ncbi:MAG: single-stranded DNA-binding protein [Ruminococcus sp.]|nr:single-stranded DNA-binding protein [Ruminococcus sp.]
MNKVILIGRLTADPELRQTQSGIASCKFTVAVNRQFADKNTGERQADFITCQAWRQTAEFVSKYFSKGKMIALTGSLRTGKYQDKNHSDVTHYTTDVFVEGVEFVGGKNDSSGQSQQQSTPAAQLAQQAQETGIGSPEEFEEILGDDDLPF